MPLHHHHSGSSKARALGAQLIQGEPCSRGLLNIGHNKNNSTHTSRNVRITALVIIISRLKAYHVQSTWQGKQFPPVQCKLQGPLNPWAGGPEQESRDAQARGREDM